MNSVTAALGQKGLTDSGAGEKALHGAKLAGVLMFRASIFMLDGQNQHAQPMVEESRRLFREAAEQG